MALSILCIAPFLAAPALAGTVTLETDTALAIERGGVTIARASGPGQLTLGEFPAGDTQLRITRDGMPPLDTRLNVKSSGATHLKFKDNTLSQTDGSLLQTDAPLPTLVLRPAAEQQFVVLIDDTPGLTIKAEHIQSALQAGPHAIEVRSADRLTIWARGRLDLKPGATVVFDIEEGRAPIVTGADWTPAGPGPVHR
jgi:hypothetical protein